jgi:Kef-type K+ transport system membrane component KefB/nucleotide-binding universal stress UspA family protein
MLLLQLAIVLAAARFLGEVLRAFNQPPVLGELLAGVALGPSLLGWVWPPAFQFLFTGNGAPGTGASPMHDLEKVATLGLILLMLLTGLETDVKVMRHMGRAAFMASFMGMLIPFGSGIGLAMALDSSYVMSPEQGRLPLALFMATAMSVSAMPVIAKILMDLKLVRRNFGVVTLSAAVVDDTMGWIILAVISGMVTEKVVDPHKIGYLLLSLAAFLLVVIYILYPLLKFSLPRLERAMRMPGGEIVILAVITFLCAAATEAMHVHAVFGAFIAGTMFRQCPTVSRESLHRIESVTLALFAPLFFGLIGLHVDLTQLHSFKLLGIVLLVAILGKILGCYLGGIAGKMSHWESLALGMCMSARGAMELVVAKIGLDLGVIGNELFSIIVLMAIITSFIAPVMLRLVEPFIPISDEEKKRQKDPEAGFLPTGTLKLLVPVSGGANALIGSHLAAHLCKLESDTATALYIETERRSLWLRIFAALWPRRKAGFDIDAYFERIKASGQAKASRLITRKVGGNSGVINTILTEAEDGNHFIILGASGRRHPIYDPFVSEVIKKSPCHVVLVNRRRLHFNGKTPVENQTFKRILVPVNGSFVADAAFEFAARYAETTGAHVSVMFIAENQRASMFLPTADIDPNDVYVQDMVRQTLMKKFKDKITAPAELEYIVRADEGVINAVVREIFSGHYDLLVIGAENKSLVEHLYLGQHIESLIDQAPCTVAVVIPKVQTALKAS